MSEFSLNSDFQYLRTVEAITFSMDLSCAVKGLMLL